MFVERVGGRAVPMYQPPSRSVVGRLGITMRLLSCQGNNYKRNCCSCLWVWLVAKKQSGVETLIKDLLGFVDLECAPGTKKKYRCLSLH